MKVLLIGGRLTAVRLLFLWVGTYFLSETSGWLQIPGYFMLMGTFPGALLVRQFRSRPIEWQLYLSAAHRGQLRRRPSRACFNQAGIPPEEPPVKIPPPAGVFILMPG